MTTKKKSAGTKRKKTTPAKSAQKIKATRMDVEKVKLLACGCDEALAHMCDGSASECGKTKPELVELKGGEVVAGRVPIPILLDDSNDDSPPVDKEKMDAIVEDLRSTLSGADGNVITIESVPPRSSPYGRCYYGVMLTVEPTQVMSDAADSMGIKLTCFDDLHWFASCHDFASSGSFTTTRDALDPDHLMRLREFCKKTGVPFRAQWVFAT